MKFIEYSAEEDASTVRMTTRELVEISELLVGLLGTFSSQDPTILGMKEPRLREWIDQCQETLGDAGAARAKASR
ncbi:MAG: hypothetical protein WDO56_00095 [Gammaproteobacteria bacterium]